MSILNSKKPIDIQGILNEGKSSEFWGIIVEALDQSIVALQAEHDTDEFKNLPADQYKLESELIRAKKQFLNTLKATPDNIVSWLSSPERKNENFDPYHRSPNTDG